MTSIIESLLAAFKDFHWLVSIDTLLIFLVATFIRWPFISCFDSSSSYGIQIFT